MSGLCFSHRLNYMDITTATSPTGCGHRGFSKQDLTLLGKYGRAGQAMILLES